MNKYTVQEQAYKNGYELGKKVKQEEFAEQFARGFNKAVEKQGKWKEHFAFNCWHYDCPFCDDGYATKGKDKTPPNYCGNCGAKLEGSENDDR